MNLPLSTTEAELIIPELIMLAGLIAIILIPNFGDASFRIPLSRMKVPILIGGNRFKLTSNPKLPNRVSLIIFSAAFFFALMQTTYGKVGDTLEVTPFSRLFTLIFTAALILATIATTHRIPARANLKAPKESDSENVATKKINALIDNRRQVDFHIILIMVGLGMSLMSMATHLFMLFVCIELASLSSYILVAFHKESKIGGEAGMKYFIVGSVASAIGIYGMSMLYLWNGDLSLDALASAWVESETVDPIAGIAVGSTMTGNRPIVEFMTFNFALVGIDQIINNAAKIRQMSGGQFKCPIVFRGPTASAGQLAATHSQAFESWYANTPGLKVIVPSNPYDAKGLLKAAIRDDDPVIFMESEQMYGDKGEVPEGEYTIPIGVAEVKREGTDVTIVSFGKIIKEAYAAADVLAKEGISCEIIDLRTVRPMDKEAILKSVKKTNRLVVLEEAWPFGNVSTEITYIVQSEAFDYLDAPIIKINTADTPAPYSPVLLAEWLPNSEDVIKAVKKVLYK